jgi:D-amino-acid dehydrogenase
VRWLELSAGELRQRQPGLSRRYTFGLLVAENGQCREPGGAGAGFRIEGGRLRAAYSSAGEIAADRAVIAAGARPHVLAAEAGDRVPLESERGYHAGIADPGIAPRYPVMPSDWKMACVMTPQGLRLAGQVELAGLEAAPNWRRAGVLRDFARQVYPALLADL